MNDQVISDQVLTSLEGATTRLGLAVTAQELLRVQSRILDGPLASLFNREALPRRPLVGPADQRLPTLDRITEDIDDTSE